MIRDWLKKPYFFISSVKFNLTLSFLFGLFIYGFLSIFKPFGMYSLNNHPILYPLGFGIITSFLMILAFICIPLLFEKTFSVHNWTVGKNIIFLFSLILTIATVNWIYNSNVQIVSKESHLISFLEMISFTFSLSFFPIFFYMYLSEKFYSKKRTKASDDITVKKTPKKQFKSEKEITVFGNNKDEKVSFFLEDLIYISSQGNYASFFLNTNNKIKEHVLRNTLSDIEKFLKGNKNIVRCHKSYIINTKYIESISGNSRGYFLNTTTMPQQIPVSRKFSKEELEKLIK